MLRLLAVLLLLFTPSSLPAHQPPLLWPDRVPVAQQPAAKGVIRELQAPHGLSGYRGGARFRASPADEADREALAVALGVEPEALAFEAAGSFMFDIRANPARGSKPPPEPAPEYFVFLSATPATADQPMPMQRTWFAYHAAAGEAKGVALLMPGMFGTPEPILELFTRELAARGWAVVQMMCQPSRFTQRVIFEVNLLEPVESINRIAAEMNNRVAEAAFAAQAAMEHAVSHHPEIASIPRVAIGMSGGAMILPTVLAREPDRYAAAIAIAGGANFFAMSDESNYKFMIGAVDFRWLPEAPSEEQRQSVYQLYLERAPLDAFNTAVAIAKTPFLLIHGSFDAAVPAKLGDLLWERLGRPERWVHEAGHEEVFMKLPAQLDQIMIWMEKAVAPGERALSPEPTPAAPPP